MYCLYNVLLNGFHVSLFQESITEAQLRFLVSMCHDLPTDTRAGILILLWEFFYKKMVGTSLLNMLTCVTRNLKFAICEIIEMKNDL